MSEATGCFLHPVFPPLWSPARKPDLHIRLPVICNCLRLYFCHLPSVPLLPLSDSLEFVSSLPGGSVSPAEVNVCGCPWREPQNKWDQYLVSQGILQELISTNCLCWKEQDLSSASFPATSTVVVERHVPRSHGEL